MELLSLQRQNAPRARPTAPTSRLAQAIEAMRQHREPGVRNTARAIDSGEVHLMYLEDCPIAETGEGYIVRVNPRTGERIVLGGEITSAIAGQRGQYILVSRLVHPSALIPAIVHEVNHLMRIDGGRSMADESGFPRYRDEFQAYWVEASITGAPDPDAIRRTILHDYPALHRSYVARPDFRAQVDQWRRPDTNILNSPAWARVERAVYLGTVDHSDETIRRLILSLTPSDRAELRGQDNFMRMLRSRLPGPLGDLALRLMSQ
ncbi:hypothetical protein [Nocardia sp. CA-120079]|uniref:hypothetical protein n=1 Tax=Nocardia sp. CA-120079 TaxID=3239974 RepID=UPI003D97BE11